MENFKAPVPVEYSNQLVLLTAQLAEYYECEPRHISDNFKRNESRFVEGKHYFRLEGEALKQFKDCSAENGLVGGLVGLRASSLYLWTERGAARHAKMLSTDKAWDVFEQLEDCYFSRHSSVLTAAPEPAQLKSSKRSEGQLSPAYVYVLLMSNNLVLLTKLGQSKNIRKRIAQIKRETGLTVKKIYFTPLMPRDKARLIEGLCKEEFSAQRIKGEFFSAKFDDVCAAVNRFMEMAFATVPQVSVFERAEKIFALVNAMPEGHERKQMLLTFTKLIADEKFS
ncbi:MAG: ORF6N domain-containing protein [Selenomonadaceae bacterium]|nr:ORF6N domain-containing protein [Selenomonadaceae bacterium]